MLELPGVTHRHVEARGMRFHVAEAGTPPRRRSCSPTAGRSTGGSGATSSRRWRPPYRVIAWDLRASAGATPRPTATTRRPRWRDDLLAVMDALEVERAGLIGHDWGAFSGHDRLPQGARALPRARVVRDPAPVAARATQPETAALLLSYQGPLSTPFLGEWLMRQGFGHARAQGCRAPAAIGPDEELHAYDDVLRKQPALGATVGIYRQFLFKELPGSPAGSTRSSA